MTQPELIAGVVLGSNSFHLMLARRHADRLEWDDHLQDSPGLAAGLGEDGNIDAGRLDRGRSCLQRFAAVLRERRPVRVGAVATGVLRKAGNASGFIDAASSILGMPVRVLSGRDEAALSYIGLGLTFGISEADRLVVDLGGGTTELVIGSGLNVRQTESVELGAIVATRRFFSDDPPSPEDFARAEATLGEELRPVAERLTATGWEETIGTGGTIMGAGTIMQLRRLGGSAITPKGIDRFKAAICEGRLEELGRDIVTAERRALLPGGVALITAILDAFGIERMKLAPGALREGLMVMLARGAAAQGSGGA